MERRFFFDAAFVICSGMFCGLLDVDKEGWVLFKNTAGLKDGAGFGYRELQTLREERGGRKMWKTAHDLEIKSRSFPDERQNTGRNLRARALLCWPANRGLNPSGRRVVGVCFPGLDRRWKRQKIRNTTKKNKRDA